MSKKKGAPGKKPKPKPRPKGKDEPVQAPPPDPAYQLALGTWDDAPYNPRKITKRELENLKHSIEFHTKVLPAWDPADGYRLVDPAVVNTFNSRLVGGHARFECLRQLGQQWVHEDDVREVFIQDENEEAALNIALNNPKAQGRFDDPKLRDLLTTIDTGEMDICMATGFAQEDFDDLFAPQGPPPAPPPTEPPGPGGAPDPGAVPPEGAAPIYTCPNCNTPVKKEKGRLVRAQIPKTTAREV